MFAVKRGGVRLAVAAAFSGVLGVGAALLFSAPALAETCTFLQPVGGNGTSPIVSKRIQAGNPFGRANWNTDFFVTAPYKNYKLFFTANSSESASYPIQAYLKFTDGSNLRVFDSTVTPKPGTGGHITVPGYPSKTTSQVNIKVGSGGNQAATGFSYRISVQGCR
jgi:hypothetical protein